MPEPSDNIKLLRQIVIYATNVGYDFDLRVEITEENEGESWVKITTINEDDETELTATVCVISPFEYVDPIDDRDEGPRTVKATLLGVWIDGESDLDRWRIIDARASSLFALLYI